MRREKISAVDSEGRTIWIADAHRDGKRFVVRADEKLTALLELQSAIHAANGRFVAASRNAQDLPIDAQVHGHW